MEKTTEFSHLGANRKVLIIDDDKDLSYSIREVFEFENFKVLMAGNGRDALELLHSLPDPDLPDLILLDYMMPVMNGVMFNSAKALDPRISPIPVVLMTANGDIHSLMKEVKAEAYMDKPMNIDQLLDVAHHFIQEPNEELSHH